MRGNRFETLAFSCVLCALILVLRYLLHFGSYISLWTQLNYQYKPCLGLELIVSQTNFCYREQAKRESSSVTCLCGEAQGHKEMGIFFFINCHRKKQYLYTIIWAWHYQMQGLVVKYYKIEHYSITASHGPGLLNINNILERRLNLLSLRLNTTPHTKISNFHEPMNAGRMN